MITRFKVKNLNGQRFGQLTVLSRSMSSDSKNKHAIWLCQCDCGIQRALRSNVVQKQGSCGQHPKYEDLIGHRFGRLTVIGLHDRKLHSRTARTQSIRWLCQCDCGKETIVWSGLLRSGHTKSCGCYAKEHRVKQDGVAEQTQRLSSYKSKAKRLNQNWQLTNRQAINIMEQNCYYCDASPSMVKRSKGGRKPFVSNGIDRVDNDRGYSEDNVVPCCRTCNVAKNAMPKDVFLEWVLRVYKHSVHHE